MAQQTISLGTIPNDGTGDTLRSGGDKINDNFDELYASKLSLENKTAYSNNATTTALSLSDLNTAYPSVVTGHRVYALSIVAGALIYIKTDTGWVSTSVTIVT